MDFVDADVINDLVHVKTMSIDEKIVFWQTVMANAKSRGIETYFFTWNMFVYGMDGKQGITESQSNATTTDYYRNSVLQTLRTYPDLAGFGITPGENLEGDKEGWFWSTYGLGIADYIKENSYALISKVCTNPRWKDSIMGWMDIFSTVTSRLKVQPGLDVPILKKLGQLPPMGTTWLRSKCSCGNFQKHD
jgi:hypothetical protein